MFKVVIEVIKDILDSHNYFDAERLAKLATHVFHTLYVGAESHEDVILVLEAMIL